MTLAKLAEWRQLHPNDPLYQCANINGIVHQVLRCGVMKFRTKCGIEGDTYHHVLAFLLPDAMVTCPQCREEVSLENHHTASQR